MLSESLRYIRFYLILELSSTMELVRRSVVGLRDKVMTASAGTDRPKRHSSARLPSTRDVKKTLIAWGI